MQKRNLVVYIAMSADGYIAKPNDDLSFLSLVEKEGEDYGYFDFIASVDTIIMGRKTYEWVMGQVPEFPHADKTTFIWTRTARPPIGKVSFYTGDLKPLVVQLKALPGKDIFCDGGAEVVNALLRDNLVDTLIVSIIPVLLGDGTRLFQDGRPEQKLRLVEAKGFETGLVQVRYEKA